ncbi:MAG: ureidoglycolate lyase [Cyanobacteria bacterium P01_H01_bin.15]
MTMNPSCQTLTADWITPENFAPYGQLIQASHDGKLFDESDAQLELSRGKPRFYIMRLTERGRNFHRITRHLQCTQCLGSLEGKDWYLAVAPPANAPEPNLLRLAAFRIPGDCFIKLHRGTWHAGPYFDHEFVDFYNLELSNTNQVDHYTHDFCKAQQLAFQISPALSSGI